MLVFVKNQRTWANVPTVKENLTKSAIVIAVNCVQILVFTHVESNPFSSGVSIGYWTPYFCHIFHNGNVQGLRPLPHVFWRVNLCFFYLYSCTYNVHSSTTCPHEYLRGDSCHLYSWNFFELFFLVSSFRNPCINTNCICFIKSLLTMQ